MIKKTPKGVRTARMSATEVWTRIMEKPPTKVERMLFLEKLMTDGAVKATQHHGVSVPITF